MPALYASSVLDFQDWVGQKDGRFGIFLFIMESEFGHLLA
jgi:hypothetical protein